MIIDALLVLIVLPIFTDVDDVDFSQGQVAAEKINGFVDKATKGLIKEIVKPNSFDENSKIMLINAIYFLGK